VSLRGAVQHFPLDTVLLLLSETGKTGHLEVRGDEGGGSLAISGGRLVAAEFDDEHGTPALGEIFTVLRGDFQFLPADHIETEDLSGDLEELLRTAVAERERIAQVREVIPHERVRFRLSDRAARSGQIVLSPEQWRALLAADGDRDVVAVAERLGTSRLAAEDVLATLVRAGMIDTFEPVAAGDQSPYRRLPPMPPIPPTSAGEPVLLRGTVSDFPLETIVQLLGATKKTGRIEVRSDDGPSVLGMADGRLVSATSGEEEGELALGSAFTAPDGEFDFVPMSEGPQANLSGEIDELLDRAATVRDRLVAVRALIPSPRSHFTLSDRATRQDNITLTPDQWRALTKIDPQRDAAAVAEELHMRRLPTMMLIADLIRGGFVDVVPAEAERSWPYVERRRAPWAPSAPPPPLTQMPAPPPEIVTAPAEAAPIPEPPPAAVETEAPIEETPVDQAAEEAVADDRLAALTGLFGPAQPAPPPASWEPPPAEPAAPATNEWTTATWETPAETAPAEEAPAAEAPAPEAPAEIDPRLAAFAWNAAPTPVEEAKVVAQPLPGTMAAPIAQPLPGTIGAPVRTPSAAPVETRAAAPAPPPPVAAAPAAPAAAEPVPAKKKGLFGFGAKPSAAEPAAPSVGGSRSAQLATFANELVAGYNSGQYGKARVEDHMLSLLMRVDEQADPIDRPVPLANDRIDVDSIERGALPETQAVPYLALLVRQIYDDAERALGKDKAKRGFKDTRDRLFGKDPMLFQAPEVASRLPKV
jgi:hypothetical protein